MDLSERLDNQRQEIIIVNEKGRYKISYLLSGAGTIAGLGYAFRKKSSVWGYFGFALLGSIVGGTLGSLIGTAFDTTKEN